MKGLFLILFSISCFLSSAQKGNDSVRSDCSSATLLKFFTDKRISPANAPSGRGTVDEGIYLKRYSNWSFPKETNSAWYRIEINVSGDLCLKLTPSSTEDDYDFALYKERYLCDSIHLKKIQPVRACISRNNTKNGSVTGMDELGKNNFVNEGPGHAYVSPLPVLKGEVYYLLINRVKDEGAGFNLHLYLTRKLQLLGKVIDENNKQKRAEIVLSNEKGDTVLKTVTKYDGSYQLNPRINVGKNYHLNFYNDSSFVYTHSFTAADSLGLKNIRTVLPALKSGSRHTIGNINFYPGSPTYLPDALPAMKNLARLLFKNDSLRIKVLGHTNGCGAGVNELSSARAGSIRNFLVKRGISPKRIEVEGKGCSEMLYPSPKNDYESMLNRRVEIMVTSY
jgi:outer membrane protein OmpA-like peptidoglycan-associated protein